MTVISVAFVWDIKTLSEPLTRSERREQEENERTTCGHRSIIGFRWMEETGLNFDHLNRIIFAKDSIKKKYTITHFFTNFLDNC